MMCASKIKRWIVLRWMINTGMVYKGSGMVCKGLIMVCKRSGLVVNGSGVVCKQLKMIGGHTLKMSQYKR